MKTNQILLTIGAALVSLVAVAQPNPLARPRPRHVEGELLVKFKDGTRGAMAEQARGRMQHEVKRRFDFIGWQQIRLPRGMSVEEGMARYRNLPGVEAVEPNGLVEGFKPVPNQVESEFAPASAPLIPNDPRFTNQWGLATVGASNAWAVTTGSSNVVVAVIDSGINYNHEDLAANMWRNPGEIPGNGIDDDGNGFVDDVYGLDTVDDFYGNDSDPMDQGGEGFYHGTACASVIGALGNNAVGIAGVNWSIQLMALRAGGTNNFLTDADILQSLTYIMLMKGRGVDVRVISMSFGGTDDSSQALRDAHAGVAAQGILQVAAAHNDATDIDVTPYFPASYNILSMISVAASDQTNNLASFSNFGRTNVDLAAPGVGILMASGPVTNAYTTGNGTSFACPLVAGAAALLFAIYPTATAEEVKAALLETVDVLPAFTNKMVSNGRLNVGRAVARFAGPPFLVAPPQHQPVVLSNNATCSVVAGGSRPLTYQWFFNGGELPDATNATLNLNSVTFGKTGDYSVVISNSLGVITSQNATLTVVPLMVTIQPRSQNIRPTSNVTFGVSVNSPVPVHYQWRFNDTNLAGTDGSVFDVTGVQLGDEGNYSVEVSNLFGSAVSSNAALVVLIDPIITIAPVTQSVVAGGSATFSVGFSGNPMAFGVEWRQGSVQKASNTVSRLNDFFTLANAHPTNGTTWRVVVRNLAKNVPNTENRTFVLTVLPDSDGDGLPDSWEATYPNANDSLADTDQDGLTNLQEYRTGTDPQNRQSYLRVENISPANGTNAVSVRFFALANKTYTVEARGAIDAGSWERVADVVATANDREVEVIDAEATSLLTRYYRLATPRIP